MKVLEMLTTHPAEGTEKLVIASRELTVENTTYCGANCIMCPRDEYQYKWQHMPMELFKNVMRQGVELGITSLDICGFGDPLMDPTIEEKLKFVKETYPHVHIYTASTAHLLTEKRLDAVCRSLDTLKISNYGFSKESYESVHAGTVKFETVWKNVHNLLARPRSDRPYVILSFLIFPENEHEIEPWKAYWKDRADEIMVWQPHNYGGSLRGEKRAHQSEARVEHKSPRSCGRPFRGDPFVRVNGDVSVCCFDFNHKLVVGNLYKQTLYNILAGEALAKVKNVHEKRTFDGCGLLCTNCDQIYDRNDALVYSNNASRHVDQPTTHPDHIVRLVEMSDLPLLGESKPKVGLPLT